MMLREIDRKFYGEDTAAILAEAPNRISAVKVICRR